MKFETIIPGNEAWGFHDIYRLFRIFQKDVCRKWTLLQHICLCLFSTAKHEYWSDDKAAKLLYPALWPQQVMRNVVHLNKQIFYWRPYRFFLARICHSLFKLIVLNIFSIFKFDFLFSLTDGVQWQFVSKAIITNKSELISFYLRLFLFRSYIYYGRYLVDWLVERGKLRTWPQAAALKLLIDCTLYYFIVR